MKSVHVVSKVISFSSCKVPIINFVSLSTVRRLADGKPDPTIKDLAEPRHDISLGPFVVDETVLSELEREIHERLQNQPLPVLQIDEVSEPLGFIVISFNIE